LRQVVNYPYIIYKIENTKPLLDLAKELPLVEGQVQNKEGHNIKHSSRKTDVGFFPKGSLIEEFIDTYIELANQYYKFKLSGAEKVQFGVYREGHFYDWHRDYKKEGYHRKLSVSVMLNDDFEGGDLEIQELWGNRTCTIPKKAGTIVIFPSMLRHRVTPVTKGVRYSLVRWYSGPEFK